MLAGTWHLVEVVEELPDGRCVTPWDRAFLYYAADGRMYGVLDSSDRPPFASPDPCDWTPEEKAWIASTFVAYAGSYTVEDDVVSHHIECGYLPDMQGSVLRRRFRIADGRLHITTRGLNSLARRELGLVFERAQ